MSPTSIPPELAQFIRDHIHSVLQLEMLLLMRENPKHWTPEAIADELRITPQSAELRLEDLLLRGFVVREGAPDSYRYAPSSAELAGRIDALAECYVDARYAVINLIFSEPGDSARSMADAFRLRKKPEP